MKKKTCASIIFLYFSYCIFYLCIFHHGFSKLLSGINYVLQNKRAKNVIKYSHYNMRKSICYMQRVCSKYSMSLNFRAKIQSIADAVAASVSNVSLKMKIQKNILLCYNLLGHTRGVCSWKQCRRCVLHVSCVCPGRVSRFVTSIFSVPVYALNHGVICVFCLCGCMGIIQHHGGGQRSVR